MGRPGGNSVSFWHSQKEKKKKEGSGKEKLIEFMLFAFQRAAA